MKTMTAALAGLLLAGASSQVLAQDHDHGARGQAAPAQAGAPAARAAPPAAPRAAPQGGPRAPQDGHARFGAPPPAGQARAGQPRFERGPGPAAQPQAGQPQAGQPRFDRGGDRGGQAGPQRFDRGPGAGPGAGPGQPNSPGRQVDRERGPREVIPPGADRGPADRPGGPGGRDNRDGRFNGDHRDGGRDGGRAGGRDGGRADNGHGGDPRNNPWRHGDRWQAGRAPPVFWSQDRFRVGAYRAPYGYYVRSWGFGDFLPRGWYGQDYYLNDFLDYDLPYPPPGYEWVRVGGDALMIDRFSGRVVQVVRGIFW